MKSDNDNFYVIEKIEQKERVEALRLNLKRAKLKISFAQID